MGLTLAERTAITEGTATRYQLASKRGKSRILDELCANTGWHRNHARKALKAALQPKIVTARSPRPVKYGPDVIAALTACWTVLAMPAGKRLAPMLGELVAVFASGVLTPPWHGQEHGCGRRAARSRPA
jgi:hypothetical protein